MFYTLTLSNPYTYAELFYLDASYISRFKEIPKPPIPEKYEKNTFSIEFQNITNNIVIELEFGDFHLKLYPLQSIKIDNLNFETISKTIRAKTTDVGEMQIIINGQKVSYEVVLND